MATRIYKVTSHSGTYLVRASARSQAIAHVAKTDITADVASQDDLVKLLGEGKKVMELREEQLQLEV